MNRRIRTTFFISEFTEEEKWLECMHRQGWKLVRTDNRFYEFERCPEEDWVYRLDFQADGDPEKTDRALFTDRGWEFVQRWKRWSIFRKKRSENGNDEDSSLFNDRESKMELCRRILKGRLLRSVLIPTLTLAAAYGCAGVLLDRTLAAGILRQVLSGLGLFLFAAGLSFVSAHGLLQYRKMKKIIRNLKQNPE